MKTETLSVAAVLSRGPSEVEMALAYFISEAAAQRFCSRRSRVESIALDRIQAGGSLVRHLRTGEVLVHLASARAYPVEIERVPQEHPRIRLPATDETDADGCGLAGESAPLLKLVGRPLPLPDHRRGLRWVPADDVEPIPWPEEE